MKKLLLSGIILLALFAGVGSVSAAIITNGGFESPVNTESWQVYPDGTSGLDWTVEQGIGPLPSAIGSPFGDTPTLEIQTLSTLTLAPDEPNQYAELDSYANVNISQIVALQQGHTYHISFAQTCRPEESGASSILGVYLDGELLSRTTCDQTLDWETHTIDVTPPANVNAKLMFADEGLSVQGYGVLLDNIVIDDEVNNIPVPEFPGIALPVAFMVGLLGAVLFIRSTKEN